MSQRTFMFTLRARTSTRFCALLGSNCLAMSRGGVCRAVRGLRRGKRGGKKVQRDALARNGSLVTWDLQDPGPCA